MRWDFWRSKRTGQPSSGRLEPFDIARTGLGARNYDLYKRLLDSRIVFVGSAIDDALAKVANAQLLFLQHQDPKAEIRVYLDSPGGSVTASLAIHDTMAVVRNDIATYCIGEAVGTAALLLSAGTKGKRFALVHSRISLADIWGGTAFMEKDAGAAEAEIARLRAAVFGAYAKHTGQSPESIANQHGTGRDIGPDEALRLGLIDSIITEPA